MKTISRNNLKVFIKPILITILTSAFGIGLVKVCLKEMNDNPDAKSNPLFYISFAACFFFIFIGFYELIKTLKKAP
jgi:hypothetical protein